MQTILDLIVDVLSQPAILVALIAFIGLVVQKKPVSVVTSGTIKTILGFFSIKCWRRCGCAIIRTIRKDFPTCIRSPRGRSKQ